MMKCRLRESRLIAINEGQQSLTAADVSAVYQINGDETKHSARNRMLANSHAGRTLTEKYGFLTMLRPICRRGMASVKIYCKT